MRVVAGIAFIDEGIMRMPREPQIELLERVLAIGLGVLLVAGFSTPFAGVLTVVLELWHAVLQPGDVWTHILLGTLGAALALVGPGKWSVDARLYGWKRLNIRKPE
jgi:uncharacterized membrane protein YphA (DoxX/SURF4 family)